MPHIQALNAQSGCPGHPGALALHRPQFVRDLWYVEESYTMSCALVFASTAQLDIAVSHYGQMSQGLGAALGKSGADWRQLLGIAAEYRALRWGFPRPSSIQNMSSWPSPQEMKRGNGINSIVGSHAQKRT